MPVTREGCKTPFPAWLIYAQLSACDLRMFAITALIHSCEARITIHHLFVALGFGVRLPYVASRQN